MEETGGSSPSTPTNHSNITFMEKVESKEKMRNMKRGATIELPISSLETIRNNVSLLNAKHFLEGKKWASKSYPKKGIVVVKRES